MAQFVLRLNSPNIATSQNNKHNYDAFFVQYFFKSLVTANHTIFKEITSIKNEKMFFLFINIDAYHMYMHLHVNYGKCGSEVFSF